MAGPLEPGDPRSLGGFVIVARLGEGGQGVVYEGRGPSGERVAVKVLKGGGDPDNRRRLARELQAAHRVAPFCTARVLGADIDGPVPYVVSEFVAGPSLQERVRGGGPLRDGDLERLAVGTASALAAIHGARVVHRDFKPANVLLGPDGPRVVDFGIARPLDAGTVTSALSGTPPYMAPEQLRGEHGSPAADVFAWAATMVFAATGRPPFGSDTVAAVFHRILNQEPDLSAVPPGLRETLAVCLSKDPGRRPASRALLMRLVDPGAATVTVPGVGPVPTAYLPPDWTAPAPAPPPVRRVRRPAVPVAAVAVAAVVAAGALYASGWFGGLGTTARPRPTTSTLVNPATTPASGTTTEPDASTTEPGASATGAASSGPVGGVPAGFGGTWTGQVTTNDARQDTSDVTLTLPPGQDTGTWRKGDCQQRVTLTRVRTGPALELTVLQQGTCVGGDMTLTLATPDTLDLRAQEGAGALEFRGNLRRP
ncbi:serine/threonine-protein kinase [Nonomuraea maritima]|uniref:serine/threonine-protein kinase n=1 Tax=Nonomuraea maritima TaxID=683260 RepID=UPI00371C12AE